METRKVESGEDPRAYVGVFARLGSPPPSRGRREKLVAKLRRRARILGQRVREQSVAFSARARARAGAALQRGREARSALALRAREGRIALGRRVADKRLVLASRGREVRAVLVRRLREERAALGRRARERGVALRHALRDERSVLVARLHEGKDAFAVLRGALVRRVSEERVILMRGVGERSAALAKRLREERAALARRAGEETVALRHALREETNALAARLLEGKAAFAHRLHDWVAARPRWDFQWHRPGPPALPRQPSIFVGLASFAFAFGVAWWTGGPTDELPQRKANVVAEQAPAPLVSAPLPAGPQPAVLDVGQVLRTPGVSEAAQLAVVDELTKDSSDVATKALLAGVDAESLHVSMACMRALSGRSCDAVATALANRLDDPLWQRRAWAARVLGSNDCAGAGRHLSQRLAVESDARVKAQLKLAINSLKEPGA